MDWTHATLHGTFYQVQGQYHSQQPASGFSQASTSTQNSSGYSRNDQVIKIHSSPQNIMQNQQSSQNNVGLNSFQPPLLKSTVPVIGFGTTQHFVGQQPRMQHPSITVQMTPGMTKNTRPNCNVDIFSPVAPQLCTTNPLQTPPNQYIALDMYNTQPQKNCSNSKQGPVFLGNINSSCAKKLPVIAHKHQSANPQTHATVLPNQVSINFLNSQQNSSYITFPSGQNIQNQINEINSGSATQQYAIPNHYTTQAIPQATNTNLRPPYPVHLLQINHGQIVLPQPAPNTSNENVQNSHNLELDQSNVSYSGQHVQIPQSVPITRESNEVGVADSTHGHSTKDHPSNELVVAEALKSTNNGLQIPGTVPFHKTSAPQTTRSMVQDNASKISGNAHNTLITYRKGLELLKKDIIAKRKDLSNMQAEFNSKRELYLSVVQKSKTSDHNPGLSLPAPSSSQQPAPPPQATNQTFSLPSHNVTQNLSSILPHDNAQNCPPSLLASSASQTQDSSLYIWKKKRSSDTSVYNPDILPPRSNASQQPAPPPQVTHQTFLLPSHNATQNLNSFPHDNAQNHPPSLPALNSNQIQDSSTLSQKKKSQVRSILSDLLKGTCDEKMLFNTHIISTGRNQSKQLFSQQKCVSSSVFDSHGVKSTTNMNDTKRESRLSPTTSQTVSTQGSLTSTDVTLHFEQTSALGKDQVTNTSAMSGGDLFNDLVLYKEKGTTVTKILTNSQSTVSVQNSSESAQLSEKLMEAGSKNSQNAGSEVIQRSKDNCLQTPDKSITAWNNGNDTSSSASLAATLPEAGIVQSSSFMGNSCNMGRTSLEELETSLALWIKSSAVSPNDQLGESTKSTICSSSLDGVEDKKMEYTMKNFPNALTHCEKSSIAVGKNEPILSSVSSSLGQKLDAVSSSPSKSSEPQIAIVPPLIVSKEGIQNEVQEKDVCSILEKFYPVITEGDVRRLHEFILTLSDTDKPVKRTACLPPDSHVTIKEVDSDMHQKTVKSTEQNGIQSAECETACSCYPNQRVTSPLELKKNTPQFYSRDSFPLETNKDSSSPVSQKCAPKTSSDLIEQEDTMLNENMFQISSVCTLVQGDAFYNSQIAKIFNSSKAEHNTSSEDQRPDSYNKEQQLSHWKKESEMNGSTSVGNVLIPSLGTLSKAIAEKLLRLPGLKIPHGGKVSDEVNVRKPEEEKNTEIVNSDCGKDPEQNMSCCDVYSRDLASSNHEVPSFENQVHSENSTGTALTLPNDQLTELLKEFPYGIVDSKTLKKTENENSPTKVNEIKDGQEIQTCGQNSEGNHALDQITVTILNPQQIKDLFPECSSQPSNKLENKENDKLTIASENTNKSHDCTVLVENTNTSKAKVQKPFCCTQGWLALKYSVDPCEHMLGKEAALKTSSTDCQLNNQQQTLYTASNNLPSEVKSNRILIKTIACGESDLQEKAPQPLKEDNAPPCLFLKKLELLKSKNEELPEKVQIDELCNQKCTTLVSKSQVQLYSGTDDSEGESLRSVCKRESSYKKRTPKDILQHRRMENKRSKKTEKYKIKHDSSETHIIKGPTKNFKRRLKNHSANEEKMKTKERPCSTVTNPPNMSNVDLASKAYNNAQHSQKHLNRQKCEIERGLEDEAGRSKHGESSSSEPVEQNKGTLARTNLKKYAYSEERGNLWKCRSLSEHNKTSKVQTSRGHIFNMYKARFAKAFSDKKSSSNKKSNTLTLQREQKKNYLNKVAFKQTEQSICLTKLEQSPSKSVWHVKSSSASEHLEDASSHQSDAVKPQMLEFKMCPEIVFRNLVSENVSYAEKLPEKKITPVSGTVYIFN